MEKNKAEELLFIEVNNHLRNTENKCLTLSISYLGIISLIISIMSAKSNDFFQCSTLNIIIFTILSIIGCIIYMLQKWYRMWKEHYMNIARSIIADSKINDNMLPYWLRSSSKKGLTVDDSIRYLNGMINLAIFLLLSYNIFTICTSRIMQFLIPVIAFSFYLLFLFIMRLAIDSSKYLRA